MNIFTSECVSAWHPDKICDQISDAILDACLNQDPDSRVAVETMGGHGLIRLTGEVTTKAKVNYELIANQVYNDLVGKDIKVDVNISEQSPDIAMGVNAGGAGDQGIMLGYATDETPELMPFEMSLARKILSPFKCDAKSQVTMRDGIITDVVLSVSGYTRKELENYLTIFFENRLKQNLRPSTYCNFTGAFETCGFDADAGVTGRKIVVDAYGTRVPVGGGAFSGKDPTKVDRSAAYYARYVAINLLKRTAAKEVLVRIAFAIGGIKPIEISAYIDGEYHDVSEEFGIGVQDIIKLFDLKKPIYRDLAKNGHFGRVDCLLPWEYVK